MTQLSTIDAESIAVRVRRDAGASSRARVHVVKIATALLGERGIALGAAGTLPRYLAHRGVIIIPQRHPDIACAVSEALAHFVLGDADATPRSTRMLGAAICAPKELLKRAEKKFSGDVPAMADWLRMSRAALERRLSDLALPTVHRTATRFYVLRATA